MGFFDGVKKSWNEGREEAKREIAEKQAVGGNDYRPSGGYDSTVASAVYSNYGVDSFDKIFEVTAPHMIKAIYDTRDNLKTNNEYHELLGKYTELEKRYNELLKQNQELLQIVKNK